MKTILLMTTVIAGAFVMGVLSSCSAQQVAPPNVDPIPPQVYQIGGNK